MNKLLYGLLLFTATTWSVNIQAQTTSSNHPIKQETKMEKKSKTIRLIYPQWQGGDINHWIPEIKDGNEAARGYYLGAELLHFLAPKGKQESLTVPISTELVERKATDGVLDKEILIKQNQAALQMLEVSNPDRIITLGGDCAVSVVPFTYLAQKYEEDMAILWIDAHPDITLPGDAYTGFHAMALAACMGEGDADLMATLPAKVDPANVLLIGIRNWERDEIKERQQAYGITDISKEQLLTNSDAIRQWLKSCKASKVVIHFDLDVLDPAEIVTAVGTDPDGMSMEQVVRIITDVAAEKELIGLTVAEAMPRTAIRLRNMLHQLPLFE
ncbi:MAG: arginase family protein [Phocaeicola sp.]